jgi:hypothetical protein
MTSDFACTHVIRASKCDVVDGAFALSIPSAFPTILPPWKLKVTEFHLRTQADLEIEALGKAAGYYCSLNINFQGKSTVHSFSKQRSMKEFVRTLDYHLKRNPAYDATTGFMKPECGWSIKFEKMPEEAIIHPGKPYKVKLRKGAFSRIMFDATATGFLIQTGLNFTPYETESRRFVGFTNFTYEPEYEEGTIYFAENAMLDIARAKEHQATFLPRIPLALSAEDKVLCRYFTKIVKTSPLFQVEIPSDPKAITKEYLLSVVKPLREFLASSCSFIARNLLLENIEGTYQVRLACDLLQQQMEENPLGFVLHTPPNFTKLTGMTIAPAPDVLLSCPIGTAETLIKKPLGEYENYVLTLQKYPQTVNYFLGTQNITCLHLKSSDAKRDFEIIMDTELNPHQQLQFALLKMDGFPLDITGLYAQALVECKGYYVRNK